MEKEKNIINVSINGVGGYIGANLFEKIKESNKYNISILCRKSNQIKYNEQKIKINIGDLLDRNSIKDWILPNSIVIHLVYMWNESKEANLIATENLIHQCLNVGVKRIIHISTAAVVGRTQDTWVNESTECNPYSLYGETKLAIENMLIKLTDATNIDLLILRPTSVYGINGEPLKKLYKNLKNQNWITNYIRSCLFGNRSLNLVHVENVIDVIEFAINQEENFNKEIFIISEDDVKENNFRDVENIFKEELLGKKTIIPPLSIPTVVLNLLLKLLKRNIVNSKCRFNPEKFKQKYKYSYKKKFIVGIKEYVLWSKHMNNNKNN